MPGTLISIATYRRPEMLDRLLASLAPVSPGDRVVVVDNDPEGSAAAVSARYPFVDYVTEPRPGIAAARNRGLDELRDEQYIAFVDDDEWVCDGWLDIMRGTLERLGAAVVVGPVIPEYPADAPDWATRGEYFARRRHPTGTALRDAPTNNTLVRRDVFDTLEPPRFDEAFSDTGGSDTELFTRLREAGNLICWCDEAIAWEAVPASRITRAWVVQRQRRLGNVRGRILARRRPPVAVAALGLAYLGYGAIRLGALALIGRGRDSFADMRFWRGVGILEATRGRLVREYGR